MCAICGASSGRETRLCGVGTLETWSRIVDKAGDYIVGYALVGDGADDQFVRVFGPIDAHDEATLRAGEPVAIRFGSRDVDGGPRVHQYFVPQEGNQP